jgi:hypothetical protein
MSALGWGILVGLVLLLFFVFYRIRPSLRRSRVVGARDRLIYQIEARRDTRVITMIERQKNVSFFGISHWRSLDIDDLAEVLRAIRLTLPNKPIDLIVHTTGDLALLAEPIADALVRHEGRVTLMVPYYAMAGGTRLALASDRVLMSRDAVLGPEACPPGSRPPLGILESLVQMLGAGRWTHTAPITFDIAHELGMPVSDQLPNEAYQLVDLYQQAASQPPPMQPVPLPSPSEDSHEPESEKA